jgi:hypothetical protein
MGVRERKRDCEYFSKKKKIKILWLIFKILMNKNWMKTKSAPGSSFWLVRDSYYCITGFFRSIPCYRRDSACIMVDWLFLAYPSNRLSSSSHKRNRGKKLVCEFFFKFRLSKNKFFENNCLDLFIYRRGSRNFRSWKKKSFSFGWRKMSLAFLGFQIPV